MSESGIDMERCLQGVDDEEAWKPKITWNNCAEQMPPADDVICRSYLSNGSIKYHKVRGELFNLTDENWQWTTYALEKLEELNNGRG